MKGPTTMRTVLKKSLAYALVLGAFAALYGGVAQGVGAVAALMTSKSIPESTVSVIDPETGTSSGGGTGTDVKIAAGDIIQFRLNHLAVPDKAHHGLQAYLTEYVPPNTEVVGVRIIDENGLTVKPRYPGIASDDCGKTCNFDVSGPAQGVNGSVSQLYADTGVFYSTATSTVRSPTLSFLRQSGAANGIEIPRPGEICPSLAELVGLTCATSEKYFAHNPWDASQVGILGNDLGNTPFEVGSPVAGPQTFYKYECRDVDANGRCDCSDADANRRCDSPTVGPWNRIVYPGALIGTGTVVADSANSGAPVRRQVAPTTLGWDVTPNAPLPAGTNALRWALGELRVGDAVAVEVSLRVTGTPLDPRFDKNADGVADGGDVNCGEVFGGDLAGDDPVNTVNNAKNQPWVDFIATPACVFLNLQFDINSDRPLARVGDAVNWRVHGKNLSIFDQHDVIVRVAYDSSDGSITSCSGVLNGVPVTATKCGNLTGTAGEIEWNLGTLAPSDEYDLDIGFAVGGTGHVSNVFKATYSSLELPGGYTTQGAVLAKPVVVLRAEGGVAASSASSPGTIGVAGSLVNVGTTDAALGSRMTVYLPAGWTVVSGSAQLGGTALSCAADCATSMPSFGIAGSLPAVRDGGAPRAFSFTANVPTGTATGLYPVHVGVWASQSGFGGSFETFFNELAFVPVAAPRATAPIVSCPLSSSSPVISGTASEPNGTIITVYFNGIARFTTTVSGGTWTLTGSGPGDFHPFGALYAGLEVRVTASCPPSSTCTAAGNPVKNESPLSGACFVTNILICQDGADNDGDGLTDFPADPGCASPSDFSEENPVLECADTIDNDGDSFVDFPGDPSCYGPYDPSESGPPQCSDLVDNDGDGLVDFPADSGCTAAGDGSEITWRACQDAADNDGDGLYDFPEDPGCHSANDDDEVEISTPATDVRARILIAFDTSGSMNWNSCNSTFTDGDGSVECPLADVDCGVCGAAGCGNTLADDSRIYKVKQGMSDVISAFGEVDYALMRFHQRAQPFACPTQNASLQAGGWQGAGPAPCSGGFSAGDLLVSFDPENAYDLLEWMDGSSNYGGVAPPELDFELRGSGTTPLAGILGSAQTYLAGTRGVDPRGTCRPYRVILVTDGAETCGGDPVAAANALRLAGFKVNVIGFATTDAAIVGNLNAIAFAGGTGSAIFVDDSATLSAAMASIVTETILVELCNGLDDDCDLLVDEDFLDLGDACDNGMIGTCHDAGQMVCRADQLGTECTAVPGVPGAEVCNGMDDDCDGLIDDGIICTCGSAEICNGVDDDCDGAIDEAPIPGVGESCGEDIGACAPGALECVGGSMQCVGATGPSAEVCNGVDDDCDTIVDGMTEECYSFGLGCALGGGCTGECRTGYWTCTAGSFGTCIGQVGPVAELCNGLDDDCDGTIDEDWPELGGACDNGMAGACLTTGVYQCTADGLGVFCTAPPITPATEVCNGIDDDCDTLIDELPLPPPIGNECGGGGGCTPGHLECVGGTVICVGAGGGTPEVCNGVDDDCDSLIDEPILPDTGADCTDPGYEMQGDVGECEFGEILCVAGGLVCVGYIGPGPELCNGLDDDCDGVGDDFAICPAPTDLCYEAQCVSPCAEGEFPCGFGMVCHTFPEGDFCIPNPCAGQTCDDNWRCDEQTGECVDLCPAGTCRAEELCVDGACFDCYDAGHGCDPGELCVSNEDGVGVCQPDPCWMNDCDPATEFCDATGACVPLECDPACGTCEVCVMGACQTDLCCDVECGAGQTCDPADGACKDDACAGVDCPDGQACDPDTGGCASCTTTCPEGYQCTITAGDQRVCTEIPDPPGIEILATGGGGSACACEVGGRRAGGGLGAGALLGLLGVLVIRRKRSA